MITDHPPVLVPPLSPISADIDRVLAPLRVMGFPISPAVSPYWSSRSILLRFSAQLPETVALHYSSYLTQRKLETSLTVTTLYYITTLLYFANKTEI